MTTKKTSKKISLIPEKTKEVALVPKDLQDQWGALEAVATAFNVLDKGLYPHSYASAVKLSLQFLGKLHEQSVELALKHPQAHMIPELKSLKEKETKNGEANEKTN